MEKKGYALLSDPLQNKGTAFRADERVQFGLTGLLPPHVDTIAEQAQRIYQQMERKSSGIEKRRFLMDVFNRNRRLFYYVFRQHIAELMPIVYDPVIAESIEQYSEQFINPQETAYLSIDPIRRRSSRYCARRRAAVRSVSSLRRMLRAFSASATGGRTEPISPSGS